MSKRLTMTVALLLPMAVASLAAAAVTPEPTAVESPAPHPAIELHWMTSLDGTVLTNPVRFPTHRGFVVLHISEHQADPKAGAPFTLAVAPRCVELARKSTSDKVIITPFDDGKCVLTVSDQSGTIATAMLYVGTAAIAALATPSPEPPAATAAPEPQPTLH